MLHDLCSNMHCILHAFSWLGPTIQLPQTEPWFISDHGVTPHSYIHFRCSWHQPEQAWRRRAGIAGITGFLAAFLAWSLAMCSLFLTIWSEICLWYHCAHLDCKSLETYSSSMKQGWVFLGVFFLVGQLCRLSLTPVSQNLVLSLEMIPGLTSNMAATLHTWTPASSCPILLAPPWRDQCAMLMLGAHINPSKLQDPISLSNNINTTPVVLIEGAK